jgi:hypothetical protein
VTKEALIAEIRKLSPQERREIVDAVSDIGDEAYALTAEDIAVVETRLKYAEQHPETVVSEKRFWENVDHQTGR